MNAHKNYKRPHEPNSTPFRPVNKKSATAELLKDSLNKQTETMTAFTELMKSNDPDWKKACLAMMDMMASQQKLLASMLELLTEDMKPEQTSADDKERKRSIVIHGLPESTAAKASLKAKEDHESISTLLDEIDADAVPTSIYRLPGNTNDSNRPRLLKVVLSTSAQQREVLKNAKKLKNSERFKGTWLRPSMTYEERQRDYELRQAAKKLRTQGKNYVYVKNWKLYVGSLEYDHVNLMPKNH